jgi:hypothetical protein
MNESSRKPAFLTRSDGIALLVIAVTTLIFFWRAAIGQGVFFHEDINGLFYPMKTFYVEALRAHRLPLWNPYIGAGYPQFAEGQIAALYPLNPLLFGLLPLTLAFNWNVILHYLLAGVFFYLFMRRRQLGVGAALIGGLVFEWSGFMVGHLQHPSIFCSVAWIPLLLYFLEDGMQRLAAGQPITSRIIGASIVIAMQVLVGYPPVVFYSLLIAFLYTLLRWITLRRQGAKLHRAIWLLGASVVAGLCLSAVQLLPTLALSTESIRPAINRLIYVTSFGLTLHNIPAFVFPNFLGSSAYDTYVGQRYIWETCGYLGLLSLFLATLGAMKRWVYTWPLVVIGLIGLMLSFGHGNPIYYVLQYVPGFNYFRAAGRYLLLWTVAGAALAAEGMQVLQDRPIKSDLQTPVVASGVLLLLVVAWIVLQMEFYLPLLTYSHRPAILPIEWVMLGCGILIFAVVLIAASSEQMKRFISPAIAAVLLADLLVFAKPYAPLTSPSFHKITPWTTERVLQDKSWFRVWPSRTTEASDAFFEEPSPWALTTRYYLWDRERMMANAVLPWHIRLTEADAAFMRRMEFAVHFTETPEYPRLENSYRNLRNTARLVGSRYMLFRHPVDDMELVEQRGRLWLYRDPNALPRAWVVGAVRVDPNSVSRSQKSAASVILQKQWALADMPLPQELSNPGEIPAQISFEDPRPEKIIIHTKTDTDGFLVLNEIYDPDWIAKLDGQPADVYEANSLLRGLYLPAGEHTIVFAYENSLYSAGLRLSLLALAVLLVIGLRARYSSKSGVESGAVVTAEAVKQRQKVDTSRTKA